MASNENEIEVDMTREMESESVALSEQDRKLLRVLHDLRLQPEIESAEDLISFIRKCETPKSGDTRSEVLDSSADRNGHSIVDKSCNKTLQTAGMIPYQYPRLASFGGESGKGDATWECFKFEVESLEADGVYLPEQILYGIRKAAKGEVAEIIRRLGTGVTVQEVMDKLNSTYGNIETRETIMKKFYSCIQKVGESVTTYTSRLEEYFDKAVSLGGMHRRDTNILKGVLYQGLHRDLKQLSTYKCDTISDYDRFKIELRKMEAEMKEERVVEEKSKPCRPTVIDSITKEKSEKSEMSEVKDLLKSLHHRINQLEESQKSGTAPATQYIPWHGERGHQGGARGRGNRGYMGRGVNGRDVHSVGRPIAGTKFSPTCWRCNKKGHVQTNCPN